MPEGAQQALIDRWHEVFTPNYRPSRAFVRGEGVYVFDADGNRYLDMLCGLAVNSFGHCHPAIVEAVRAQVGTLAHVSNLYATEPAVRLAERLVEITGYERIFLCNSGAEAVEAALKLSRLYHRTIRQEDRFEIVAFEQSFHGRTFGAITCTGQPRYHKGFEPLLPGVRYVEYGDLAGVKAALGPRTAAVIVEAVQGEGGVRPAPAGFLAGVRAACDDAGALLILDEIQTGMGRTGRFFAHEHDGIRPDLVTLAKALGGGLPIGALLASREVGDAMVLGTHATTFGGNPVVCAAALAALDLLTNGGLLEQGRAVAERLHSALRGLAAKHPTLISEVRGRGLLVGLELTVEARPLAAACLERGVVVGTAGERVLRMAPAFVLTDAEVVAACAVVAEVLAGMPA